jgi:hypothetical protein
MICHVTQMRDEGSSGPSQSHRGRRHAREPDLGPSMAYTVVMTRPFAARATCARNRVDAPPRDRCHTGPGIVHHDPTEPAEHTVDALSSVLLQTRGELPGVAGCGGCEHLLRPSLSQGRDLVGGALVLPLWRQLSPPGGDAYRTGVPVDHTTVYRWVQRYGPELDKRTRWYVDRRTECRRNRHRTCRPFPSSQRPVLARRVGGVQVKAPAVAAGDEEERPGRRRAVGQDHQRGRVVSRLHRG